jgi:predicted  nucleic acid-binding Zn-ribbon protein
VAANHALIGGVQGGDRQLSLVSQISPSQQAIGRRLDNNQRKTVEEAQKNLAAQTKKVDEAVAVIQRQGSSPQQIEAAAKEALFHVRFFRLFSKKKMLIRM